MLPNEDRYFMTKPELFDKITGLLGGRVAEEIIFGEVSTGASNDFQRATTIAHKMITEYGMSEKLGPIQFNGRGGSDHVFLGRDFHNEQTYSDAIAYEIDQEMKNFINYCYERAKKILTENRDKLELIAQTLLEVETLDAFQIKSLFEKGVLPDPEEVEEYEQTSESKDLKVNIQSKKDDDEPDTYEKSKEKADKKYEEKSSDEHKENDEDNK